MPRSDGREPSQLRPVSFVPDVAPHAAGSVLVSFGNTRVICAATVQEDIPRWMKAQGDRGQQTELEALKHQARRRNKKKSKYTNTNIDFVEQMQIVVSLVEMLHNGGCTKNRSPNKKCHSGDMSMESWIWLRIWNRGES